MITGIENNLITVESNGKPAGLYTWEDFSQEELEGEKYNLVGRLLHINTNTKREREKVENTYKLITLINGELDARKLAVKHQGGAV